jgi:hypothetical protein
VSVIGDVGAGFDFVQFVRGGGAEEEANTFLALVFNDIRAHIVCRIKEILGEEKGGAFRAAKAGGLDMPACFFESKGVSGFVFGGRCSVGGRMGQMVAAWSKWLERRVVNCEARESRSSVEAVDEGVLKMAACREAVWLMRSGVLCWYLCMC